MTLDLRFDRGTILISSKQQRLLNLAQEAPNVVWDQRVAAFRSPARAYAQILGFFRKHNIETSPQAFQAEPLTGWQEIELRSYQDLALSAWRDAGGKGLLVLPTGSGKTRLAMAAMQRSKKKTLCLVPTRILTEQWIAEIKNFYKGPIGIYGDGKRNLEPITVSTFESAYRHMAQIGSYFELLIIDEAHHFGCGMRDECLEMSLAPFRLGLTATPPKDEEQLEKIKYLIGPVLYKVTINELVGKFLARFTVNKVELALTQTEQLVYDREIKVFRKFWQVVKREKSHATWKDFIAIAQRSREGLLAIAGFKSARAIISLTQAKRDAVRTLLKRHSDSRMLIFTANTANAYKLSKEFLIPPLTADIKRSERERLIAAFREGSIRCIVSCRVLNEGFDVPDAEVAIILGGSHGEREHLQRIGRLLRPRAGKQAIIYEFVSKGTLEVKHALRRSQSLRNVSD